MKLLILVSMAFLLGACSGSSMTTDSSHENAPPAKSFSLDPEKEYLYVGVFGRHMGTPDNERMNQHLEFLKSQGRIQSLEIIARGIEGGAGYCVQLRDRSNRESVLSELKQFEISLTETAYSLISVNNCDCYREGFVCDYFGP